MAIIDMKKVFLIGLQTEKEKILNTIQRMGNMEISEIDERDMTEVKDLLGHEDDHQALERIESQLSEVKFALEFIGRYNNVKRGLFTPKHGVSVSELREVLKESQQILKITKRCRELEDELAQLRAYQTRTTNMREQLIPWQGFNLPMEETRDTLRTRVIIGTVDKRFAPDFENTMTDNFALKEFFIEKVGESREDANYLLIYHKALEEQVDLKLKEYNFNRVTFSGMEGTPATAIRKHDKQLKDIELREQEIEQEVKSLGSKVRELETLYDALSMQRDKEFEALKLLKTGSTFLIRGWIPSEQASRFTETLLSVTNALYIDLKDPEPHEDFPVAVENRTLVQPFEVVTDLYSTPNSNEVDPNPFMAPFYFMFFGIMMGDAGYGIILAVMASLAVKKLKLKGGAKKLVGLLALGGVGTFLWGVISGGWFGNAGQALGLVPLWFDPINEPLKMLVFCFALGLLQIFVGMGIKAYMSIRKGNVLDAVFDQGFWYVLLIGLIVMATISKPVGQYMAIVGAIGLILTQGRHKKNVVSKLFSGIMSLYDITGYFSDVLSYSRLFALGLATGVIGTVINQLALMAGTSWIGWIVAGIILVIGHGFNIAVNILGAFVHSSRLQYIEFFGRFFEGGGHAFQPLSIKTKFIDVYEKEEAI
jgi:V/A-type H+-transporting ATPase subunit I